MEREIFQKDFEKPKEHMKYGIRSEQNITPKSFA